MTKKDYTFQTQFTIRSYEVGTDHNSSISTVANLFQESAGLHAKKLNFDITDLHKKGLTWVLYKMHIRVKFFPGRWDDVLVTTWPSTGNDIRAFRSYEMKDKNGELCAEALGQWMALDVKKRRPRRIPEELSHFPPLKQSNAELHSDKSYISPVAGENSKMITSVGRYDLDMNNHVNSVKYIEWSAGFENKFDLQCTEIKIQHHAEAYYGDKIYRAAINTDTNEWKISLFNQDLLVLSTAIARYT